MKKNWSIHEIKNIDAFADKTFLQFARRYNLTTAHNYLLVAQHVVNGLIDWELLDQVTALSAKHAEQIFSATRQENLSGARHNQGTSRKYAIVRNPLADLEITAVANI